MIFFSLVLAVSAFAQQAQWQVSFSSVAVLAAETVVVYTGAPSGLKADPTASTNNDVAVVKAEEKDGAWTWTILPLSTGTISFAARYKTADGKDLEASAIVLNIKEAKLPEGTEILDIKPPLKAWPALWPWLLAAALGYGAWLAWKRWQQRPMGPDGEPFPLEPPLPPETVAAEAIAELLASGLWEKDQAAYYLRLTEILRVYLEARYAQPVTAMTSAEVARLVKTRANDLRVGGAVRELLSRADLVKFARAKSASDEGRRDADLALSVIKDTSPQYPADPEKPR
jgi:hypothetical protein